MRTSRIPRIFLAALCFGIAACGKSGDDRSIAIVHDPVPESFVLFDIGANTRLNDGMMHDLVDRLGNHGRETPATINLGIRYDGFLERYYRDLHLLNRRLNRSPGFRAEYDVVKLTFRNAAGTGAPFDFVEAVFHGVSGVPLLFKCRSRQDISGLPDTLRERYGVPDAVDLEDNAGRTLIWRKNGDVLIFTVFRGRYVKKEYDLMIVFLNSIEKMLAVEENRDRDKEFGQVF